MEKYGWGVSTLTHRPRVAGVEDPNQLAFLALTPAERLAWETTLHGDPSGGGNDGCRASAGHGSSEADSFAFQVSLIDDAYEIFIADPATVDFYLAWSYCLSELGYEYGTPNQAEADLREAASGLADSLVEELMESDPALLNSSDGHRKLIADLENSDPVIELQSDEIRFARASLSCGVGPPYLGVPDELHAVWVGALGEVAEGS